MDLQQLQLAVLDAAALGRKEREVFLAKKLEETKRVYADAERAADRLLSKLPKLVRKALAHADTSIVLSTRDDLQILILKQKLAQMTDVVASVAEHKEVVHVDFGGYYRVAGVKVTLTEAVLNGVKKEANDATSA